MRNYLFLFLLASSYACIGQEESTGSFYMSSDLSFGNYKVAAGLIGTYVLKNEYSLSIGVKGFLRDSGNTPDDYSRGSGFSSLFDFAGRFDEIVSFNAMAGRIYNLNNSGTIRFHGTAGLGYTVYNRPTNFVFVPGESGPNYAFSNHQYGTISLIISPKIEFPFSKYFGMTLTPSIHLNKDDVFYSIGFGYMLGKLK
ncbi:hypothetical protein LX97_01764 [Nonlabens dokdonensis]|jgi:hypothetical protein|uniref:Uncharacterized protein n=2 Tax=Nonlabens dokdonensis TaxID=328515 RepID=L7W9W7_NONDD|nr:hypothetical protein [Nonlabens dokdonensis]AGC77022.1 hypothetical protein DDD_1895 [Nonlabens dokdonensis DSW-6]PZX40985.1 hypothetical protein LX97_01764 [Nonlabens dokdonensis]